MDLKQINAIKNEEIFYTRYQGQSNAQPVFLQLFEDGSVSVDVSGEIGNSVTEDVWHKRTIRWTLPAGIKGSTVKRVVESVGGLLAVVHDGHTVEWDGRNRVGTLTEDADNARYQIERELEDMTGDIAAWDVRDWLFDAGQELSDHWPAGTTLAQAVEQIEREATDQEVFLEGDVSEALLHRAECEDGRKLTPEQLDALRTAGRIE